MTTTLASNTTATNNAVVNNSNNNASSDAPQRGHSIRSIITLPSYSRLPKEEEQVIAVEGERSGMDLVVEFPETAEEEEDRREEEMDSLYHIRLRRREELAEREARRRQRREAREAGDTSRLQQLSRDSMASRAASNRNNGQSASAMLSEHQSRDRHRRISSVTYAEIGHVRHDGSRIRADSNDSDQRPLLDSSARHSTHSILSMQSQARSSVSGISTLTASLHSSGDDDVSPPNEPAAATEGGDLSTAHIPPPSYDYEELGEAPAYESPITGTREHEGHLLTYTLPQIRIDTASPLSSVVPTPITAVSVTPASIPHQPTPDSPEDPSHPSEVTHSSSS